MRRILLSLIAGYFSITLINSFIYFIIAIYFQTEISITGVSHLPSSSWAYGLTGLQFLLGMFAGLLVTTLAQAKAKVTVTAFILLMLIISLINYSVLAGSEPLWFLIGSPALLLTGIYSGFFLQSRQPKN